MIFSENPLLERTYDVRQESEEPCGGKAARVQAQGVRDHAQDCSVASRMPARAHRLHREVLEGGSRLFRPHLQQPSAVRSAGGRTARSCGPQGPLKAS
jgi:hypothetical protein